MRQSIERPAITLEPTGGGVGAFVHDIDLRSVGSREVAALRAAIGQHGVLFFRDQSLDPDSHVALAEQLGTININRFFGAVDTHPQIAMVVKEKDQKDNIGGNWHTDHSYDDVPAFGSILVAVQTPPRGGDTIFANTFEAYNGLSDGLKKSLAGLRACHSSRHAFGASARNDADSDLTGRLGNPEAALQDSVHPVVIRHPISKRKSLYVNPGFTLRFEGWTAAESKPLLDFLYSQVTRPENTYRFQWQPGSVAFWDNRATWHYALNDYPGYRRLMHRIILEGEPLAA